MNIALFYHSLLSDWNHGNAHFLRGIARELQQRGHQVQIFEPARGWSLTNLLREHGDAPIAAFRRVYPRLRSTLYYLEDLQLENILADIDLVLVHEWNDPELVRRIGAHHKAKGHYRLLFHDTHHRSVSEPQHLAAYDLSGYDGVLAYGDLKRVELAVALAGRPRLLLMDEPTAGMAPAEREALMRLAAALAREERVAVLFTEHDMDVVFTHADRVIVLAGGELIAEGPPPAVRADARVREIYLGGADA